jgi:hypothetical protein
MYATLQAPPDLLTELGAALDAIATTLHDAINAARADLDEIDLPAAGWRATPATEHVITVTFATLATAANTLASTIAAIHTTAAAYDAVDRRSSMRQGAIG